MYSVIIVDDEKNILLDIEIMLKNSGFKYKNIYMVQTGIEAKRIIENDDSVRLVLSDINMPELNGIQLLEYIKGNNKNIRVIFITGYASFEYAKRAVELGAAGFILKPIKEEELCDCIAEAHRYIKAETEKYKEYSVNLIGSVLRIILRTGKCTEEEQNYITDACELTDSPRFCLAMLSNDAEDEKVLEYIKRCIEECDSKSCKFYLFKGYDKKELLCLCVIHSENVDRMKAFTALLERIKGIGEKTYIGISGVNDILSPTIYRECENAFYEKIANHTEQVFFYHKEIDDGTKEFLSQAQLLEQAMVLNDYSSVELCIRRIFDMHSTGKNYFRDIYRLVEKTILLYQENTLKENEEFIDESQFDSILKNSETVEDVIKCVCEYVRLNCIIQKDLSVNMYDVIAYVDENCMKELTLDKIGTVFDISSYYLSRIFKKKTGKNFVQYINDKRMERAVELLLGTDMTVVKISELVGFNDQQYFHKLFKKYYGATPIEYRMENFKKK